jgi:hypothetical protein
MDWSGLRVVAGLGRVVFGWAGLVRLGCTGWTRMALAERNLEDLTWDLADLHCMDRFALYTVKKGSRVSRPQPGCHYTKLSLGGNNDVITEFFLPRGSLVSDIPAGDGKLVNLFLRCMDPI